MENLDVQVFSNLSDEQITNMERANRGTRFGFIYAIEYGNAIKIGCTHKPHSRFIDLRKNAEHYGGISLGRVCLIGPLYKYYAAESVVHKLFSESRRLGTELFDVPFDLFVKRSSDFDIIFEYNEEELNKESELFLAGLKKLLGWDNNYCDKEYLMDVLESKIKEERLLVEKLERVNSDNLRKVRCVDELLSSTDVLSLSVVPKILNFGIGYKKLLDILRNENILSSKNIPTDEYSRNGWFCFDGKRLGVYQIGVYGIFRLLKEKYSLQLR